MLLKARAPASVPSSPVRLLLIGFRTRFVVVFSTVKSTPSWKCWCQGAVRASKTEQHLAEPCCAPRYLEPAPGPATLASSTGLRHERMCDTQLDQSRAQEVTPSLEYLLSEPLKTLSGTDKRQMANPKTFQRVRGLDRARSQASRPGLLLSARVSPEGYSLACYPPPLSSGTTRG